MRIARPLALAAVLALVAAACGGSSGSDSTDGTTGTTAAPAATTTAAPGTTAAPTDTTEAPSGDTAEVTVIAANSAYNPSTITVKAGQTVVVTFTDEDFGADEPHNIHFDLGGAKQFFTPIPSSTPSTNTVTFVADTPGEYDFWCDTHPAELTGTLIVEP